MMTDTQASTTTTPGAQGNRRLTYALHYASMGLAVVALHTPNADGGCSCGKPDCGSVGKHPRWDEDLQPHGANSATKDPDRIRRLWARWPAANVGIATGAVSGITVCDIDARSGGLESLAGLEAEHGALPSTWTADTGGGGEHRIFQYQPGIKNDAGEMAPGIDFRNDGGLIVAAPSLHASGKRYTWRKDERQRSAMPAWLVTMATTKPDPAQAERPAATTNVTAATILDRGAYWRAALAGLADEVRQEPNGNRNKKLNRCAFRAGQLIGAGIGDRGEAENALTAAARAAGLAESEIGPTLKSGLSDGMLEPAKLPEFRATTPAAGPAVMDANYLTTDTANGERLARLGADRLRYVPEWGWLAWDGRRWLRDVGNVMVMREARAAARSIYGEAQQARDDTLAKRLSRWADSSLSRNRLEAMISLAASMPGITASANEFDADPWALNCDNGTVDLQTGDLRPHRPDDRITKLAPVAYDPAARSELWLETLLRIFDGDGPLTLFYQKAAGYSLTGDTSEQCWFLCYGTGANGKSTTLEMIRAVLGDYAQQADPAAFLVKRGDGPTNDVARMKGARFIAAIEVGEGRRLAEALVKQMTGGDTLTARFLHHEHFEFKPAFKLWMAANHKPVIRGTDLAIWRRVRMLPFTVTIPEPERDKHLADKLRAELPGILSWAVRGCLLWQAEGLQPPEPVTRATEDYRAEMDTFAAFLDECCERKPDAQVTAADLYKAYTTWAGDDKAEKGGTRQFGMRLKERGFTAGRSGGVRVWSGLRLLTSGA